MSWIKLEKKAVVITGGAGGIGLAIAKGFLEVGANVLIADFNEDAGRQAVEECMNHGSGEIEFTKCDVSFQPDVNHLIQKVVNDLADLMSWSIMPVLIYLVCWSILPEKRN